MPLAHIVQQVLHAFGDALALGFQGFLLGFGVESQEVARRCGRHALLYGKAQAVAGFFIGIDRVGQRHQGATVKQIDRCAQSSNRVLLPGRVGKALVLRGQRAFAHQLGHQSLRVLQVLFLYRLQLVCRKLDCRGHRGLRYG